MSIQPKFPAFFHGGDYNPEQWPPSVWDEDIELMKEAGWNIVSLAIFGWGRIQKDEESFDFEWLDTIMDKLHAAGIQVCLATATAATPPWLDAKYPDILRTEINGNRRRHGGRHTFNPFSEDFRRLSVQLARKMAERYGNHPALFCWHVSNEYGEKDYGKDSAVAFRRWLQERYRSLDEVNFRWNMAFWGQTFRDWSEIEPPYLNGQRNFQGLIIDYDRFQSEAILAACEAEIEVLRELSPEIPITTNMMGSFKPLDYHSWAKKLDVISWDSYPGRNAHPSHIAFQHSLMRGLKEGEPWMLMEQTPSQQNWQDYNSLKRPGIMRLWSLQALAHGSNSVMYFQWRRSPGAQEMFHGAVVEHAGSTEARVFREVAALGAELATLPADILESRVQSRVAVLFDWDNWWAIEYSSGPSKDLNYVPICQRIYQALWNLGVVADVVSPEADLSGYSVVVAPTLKMVKPGVAEKLSDFVSTGGVLVSTFFSGIVDETDRAFSNGYPGPLSDLFGIWVEETDALSPEELNEAVFLTGQCFPASLLCDVIHLRGAEQLAYFGQEFYAGWPCITENFHGEGRALYVGTHLSQEGYEALLARVLENAGVWSYLNGSAGIEEVCRTSTTGVNYLFVLNHNRSSEFIALPEGQWMDHLSGNVFEGSLELGSNAVVVLSLQQG